ncbi:tRNA-(ms[2]io[6]A)-hydroxylase [Chryseolinea sp. H1M3-3]|uniref:tRNA-(ms[2]io[6]A)-hydroxylase n=1 Tax=Chryseolinea sp. H1M3-3 TaxID=3034144 RepID=UPI0023ED64F2|nr:tRNA-(ms[2]io[6]A)-hydroxylase [Chryseolinea sp. H1M3-3]
MKIAKDKFTLGLELPSDPRWIDVAKKNIKDILIDHAYCEQKAASSCISLIIQHPDREKLVEMLAPVVKEEWEHFERVLAELKKRGFTLGPQRKDEYVEELTKFVKKGGSREQHLVEKLLLNALIEARSCERFKMLWKTIPDKELSEFYHELMISEAGHYKNFLQLAKEYLPEDVVMRRWEEWLGYEAGIMKQLEVRGDRIH